MRFDQHIEPQVRMESLSANRTWPCRKVMGRGQADCPRMAIAEIQGDDVYRSEKALRLAIDTSSMAHRPDLKTVRPIAASYR